jgi:patatin-like phospholipase/acyl hydrolase
VPTTARSTQKDFVFCRSVRDSALDGGGVRGLSSLLILKALMANVNAERIKDGKKAIKPCELFDMIGGTSTGG